MENKNDQQIAQREETAIAAAARRPRGFEEETDRADLIFPRAKLLQPLSPEVMERPVDFRPGLIINSLTKEILPSEFIPIFKFTNWIRFNPRSEDKPGYDKAFKPGAVIWRSVDPFDPKVLEEGKFGPNGEPPLATKFLNFFSIFISLDMPVVLSFSKTSYKPGKQLMSLAKFSGGDMFGRKYKLASKLEKNDQFTYFVLSVEPAGNVEGDLFKKAESYWEEYHDKSLKVHDEEVPEEDLI